MTQGKTISRRALGRVAASLWPDAWSASLATAAGWNARTVERLGTPRMPLDERRARVLADCLDQASPDDPAANEFADWLRDQFQP